MILARGKEALDRIQSSYTKTARVVVGDMADLSLPQKAVDVAIKEFGRLDGLVLNHGVLPPVTTIGNCDLGAWKENFDVNFFSAVAFVSKRYEVINYLGLQLVGQGCSPIPSTQQRSHPLHLIRGRSHWLWQLGSVRCFEGCIESPYKNAVY